jgi:hypothetical protein
MRGLDVYYADDEDENVLPPHPPIARQAPFAQNENVFPPHPPAARQAPFVQPQILVFQDNPPQFPAYSAARPAQPSLPRRARAPRRAASIEVDDPRATIVEAPPLAAPVSGPQMSLPKLELPTFKGEKGAKAQTWLESLGRFQKFYRLTDEQAVELARFSCKGSYAKTWAGMLPDDLTFATFKEHFKAEFAVENLVGTCALGAVTCRQTRYSQLTRP